MDIRSFFGKPKGGGGSKKSSSNSAKATSSDDNKKSNAAAAGKSTTTATKKSSSAADIMKMEEEKIVSKKEAAANKDDSDDDDTDMEDVAAVKNNKKATVVSTTKKRKESPSSSSSSSSGDDKATKKTAEATKNRRKIIIDSSDDSDDSDDDDYQPEPSNNSSKKLQEAATTSITADSKTKAATAKKQSSSPKAASKAASVKKEQQQQKPPKFHPPSSKLLEHLNDDADENIIQPTTTTTTTSNTTSSSSAISDFFSSIDTTLSSTITPHCLTGLTFRFTGVLSYNDEVTRATNAAVSLASPSKGDYYRNRQYDTADSNLGNNNSTTANSTTGCELSRENATDIIKILGGRVTTAVSSKTDYLIAGNILEDGRYYYEGSKYKKCVELWKAFQVKKRQKAQKEQQQKGTSPNKKQKTTKKSSSTVAALDPNNLVEVICGLDEFYSLLVFVSEWKKGMLTDDERRELEEQQRQQQRLDGGGGEVKKEEEEEKNDVVMADVKDEKKVEEEEGGGGVAATTSNVDKKPAAAAVAPSNPYDTKPKSSPSATVANPYANNRPVANPYANKKPVANPYGQKQQQQQPVANPYGQKQSSPVNNPYASKKPTPPSSATTTTSNSGGVNSSSNNGKSLGPNALWADKYAPKSTRDILGNKTSVDKLSRWLDRWEGTFNNPKSSVKSLTAPNGPRKAALLSGPPGIGKTTTATLIARQSGRDVLELNASDARSKKALSEALGDVTGSQVLSFANQSSKKHVKPQKRVIIMDEVDGMGAGDRSGMAQLIQMIKNSKVPIICICNDRQSQKVKSLAQYCLDLRYQRPVKTVIARRAVEIGQLEGMTVEPNAAEAIAESCGNDIRQVLNCLQMWSCKKSTGGNSANMTYKDLKDRKEEINKDEVLRVSMFDACRRIVEGSRGVDGTDLKAVTSSLMKRSDAYFVDYMLMGLMVNQNYLKVCSGQFNKAKLSGEEAEEVSALNEIYNATEAMSDFAVVEENLRGGDQNWALLPLSAMLAVKVGHHAGGPNGGFLPGNAEFAGWLGKNSSRNKKIRLLGELRHHMNYKVSADSAELRMNYLPLLRKQFQELLFDSDGAKATEAIELMDEYGLDRDDIFENLDEFVLNSGGNKEKKFGDLDSKSKAAFTRAYNSMSHKAQALVSEQGAEKTKKRKAGAADTAEGGGDLDAIDDDKNAAGQESDEEDEEDMEALKKKFMKKGRGSSKGKGASKGAKTKKSKK